MLFGRQRTEIMTAQQTCAPRGFDPLRLPRLASAGRLAERLALLEGVRMAAVAALRMGYLRRTSGLPQILAQLLDFLAGRLAGVVERAPRFLARAGRVSPIL